jgi:transposase
MDEELGDEQWELIAPLLPQHKRRGRPRADDRRTMNGILWMLRSGARWRDLPTKYGSRSTCHRRLKEWQDQGVWQKGGEDIAYGWKGKGSTVHLVTEGNGLPLAFVVTAANVSEVTVGLEVLDRVKVPRPQGRPRQRPASLAADKSYDSADFRWELRRRGIQPSIPRRVWQNRRRRPGRPPLVHPLSQSRWKVERSHGWLDNWRRLVTRYDWYTESYIAFLTIACFMVTLSRILG